MKKKIVIIICIMVSLWILGSTIEVWAHQRDTNYTPNKTNYYVMITKKTTEMRVVEVSVEKETDTFEVTVEDIKGNLWAYIDDEPKEIGDILKVTKCGDRIIDAR